MFDGEEEILTPNSPNNWEWCHWYEDKTSVPEEWIKQTISEFGSFYEKEINNVNDSLVMRMKTLIFILVVNRNSSMISIIDWIKVDTMKHKQIYLHHNKNDE